MFVIYVNDLATTTCGCSICMYADDTAIFCYAKKASDIERKLNQYMISVELWQRAKGLFLNTTKRESKLWGAARKLVNVPKFHM